MKDAFENNMKQSLEDFEMPYDSAAWTAMQSRLDATTPTPSFEDKMKEGLNANEYPYNPAAWAAMSKRLDKGSKGGFKKWYYAAGILGAAAITTAVILNLNSNDASKKEPTSTEKVQTSSNHNSVKTSGTSNGTQKVNTNTPHSVTQQNSNSDDNTQVSNTAANVIDPNTMASNTGNPDPSVSSQNTENRQANTNNGQPTDYATANNNINDPIQGQQNNTSDWKFVAPAIPEMVCQGSVVQIENKNDYPLVIIYPNGLNWVGNDHQVTRLNPSLSGSYKLGYLKDQQFVEKSRFVVNDSPVAEFDFVDLSEKYLNGLPTIEVRATSNAATYEWEYKNGTVHGEEVGLHFYEKGVHPVKLTVTDENGCSSTIEKTVNVNEKYNLLAMNSFRPNSSLQENTTFMPYALTERDANFTMLILDPNDGHVMYETSDASKGWNGIDQSTGSLAPAENAYIWKVTIMNPQTGEPNAYTGTILLLK